MKKFISMVMAAAMVVSLVPATAFAADAKTYGATGTASFKVVGAQDYTEKEAAAVKKGDKATTIAGPELQIKVSDINGFTTGSTLNEFDVTLDFTGAEVAKNMDADKKATITVNDDVKVDLVVKAAEKGDSSIDLVITENTGRLAKDNLIVIDMNVLDLVLTRATAGATAKVEVSGDFGKSEALTFASVLGDGIKVTLAKVSEVTEGEVANLEKTMEIKANVGKFVKGQRFELKLNSGFEFTKGGLKDGDGYTIWRSPEDENVAFVQVAGDGLDTIKIKKDAVEIEAVTAKVGAVAKLTVKAIQYKENNSVVGFKATAAAVEAVKVIGEEVLLKVDADEDVPVIYSGVNVENYGITNDSDHESLEVTVKESAIGALDVKKAFELSLPEGVFVTKVEVTGKDGVNMTEGTIENAFKAAYKKGDHTGFEFARKTFVATDDSSTDKTKMDMKFKLTLVAVPGFTGDVTLKLEGDAFEKTQEVVIAKFVAPYTVEAQTNDLIIDYRNTTVPTDVIVKEAEAGLWENDEMNFVFSIDKSIIELEDDAKFAVNSESGMTLKDMKDMSFKVKKSSGDEAAVVTISNISLYMNRSIAAGAYHLKLATDAGYEMMINPLFTTEKGALGDEKYCAADVADWSTKTVKENDKDVTIFDGKAATVKEGFVNVVTAGRDKDDASFTTKVVVPVGEAYIVAGETQIALDVPAYINAAGYTMLPVRAVATALGINNDNVIWSDAAKQVTVLYGQRIITMTVGEAMVYVNGSAIPASAAVEITDGRAFLGLRDLANALGVTTIDWNSETKTATLN